MVLRIFTESSISLSPCWRQQGSRYTIRAGRYLCDKEFRYLRTVRVTAAVYRGFHSKPITLLLFTFQHRAGVRLYTSCYHLAESCVFNKQSLPPGMCRFPRKAPLLPKLRGHFAEFLQHGSLKRLSILYLFTCVGLGYGSFCTGRIKILSIPPSFFLEVHQPAQSSNSRVTRGLVVAKATSSLSCTHRTKPFRGFLRDRFTLRRFTERRNP